MVVLPADATSSSSNSEVDFENCQVFAVNTDFADDNNEISDSSNSLVLFSFIYQGSKKFDICPIILEQNKIEYRLGKIRLCS